jgi:hypothetical protein
LVAHGHDAGAIAFYSVDKLKLFYDFARKRVDRSRTIEDLRMLQIVHTAVRSFVDKEGIRHYKSTEASLLKACGFAEEKPKTQKAVVGILTQRLTQMGAKRIYGRNH